MVTLIDNFLNKLTMYRLVFYCLLFLIGIALLFSLFGLMPFTFWDLLGSTIFLVAACIFINYICAQIFKAPTNIESVYITALILALIIAPNNVLAKLVFLSWAAVLAMASKYTLAISKKHIFNPAALSVALTSLVLGQSANWWVANLYLAPFTLIVGFLIVRKIKKYDLIAGFLLSALITISIFEILKGADVLTSLTKVLIYSPILFFAAVMLTEPMTTPPTKPLRLGYGILVGFLFAPQIHFGIFYTTPELALVLGNVFSYLVSPKQKLVLQLKDITKLSPDSFNFVFAAPQRLNYHPGQYLEWTLEHDRQDRRGIRRYFTLASSPTEPNLILGVKFYDQPSSFKKTLLGLKFNDQIIASQLAGDFTLPKNAYTKLAFISGGIGVTPFRSILKYLLDTNQKRDIIILNSNRNQADILYPEIFDQASRQLGLKIYYALTGNPPSNWRGLTGPLTEQTIRQCIPDYQQRIFYLSGPHAMVKNYKKILSNLGIKKSKIKTDYFPGFA